MPKLTHSLPKYRKHRASGQAVTTIGGKDFYLGPYGTRASKREYDRLIAEWLATDRSPVFGKPAEVLTVVEIVVAYLHHAKAYYGTGTTSEYHRLRPVLKAVKQLYGKTAAEAFGPAEFKAIRQQFIDAGNSRTYINANMKRVVRMFKWAASEGKLSPTVPQTLALIPALRRGKCTARETAPVAPVDDEVVGATLPHLPVVVADMVRLQRLTGMRPAELCSASPGGYRPDKGGMGVSTSQTQDRAPRQAAGGIHRTERPGDSAAVPGSRPGKLLLLPCRQRTEAPAPSSTPTARPHYRAATGRAPIASAESGSALPVSATRPEPTGVRLAAPATRHFPGRSWAGGSWSSSTARSGPS